MTDVTFPDEVVTEAKLRLIDIPSGTFGLISLDNGRDHTRPSTFGPQGLRSLQAALDEAAATPGIVGIGVTECSREGGAHLARERVHRLGPVEGDDEHAGILVFDQDGVGRVGHRRRPYPHPLGRAEPIR